MIKMQELLKLMSFKGQKTSHDIILIDDDPVFGHLFESTANQIGISVRYLSEVGKIESINWHGARAILVDHELEKVSGTKVVNLLKEKIKVGFPLIFLVSENSRIREISGTEMESCFFSKSIGTKKLINQLLARLDSDSREIIR